MKISIKISVTMLFVLFSAVSQAKNYYVCDSTGDDSNLGLSESKPFKTYDKAMANFNSLEAGSSILFCRGGEFPATQQPRLSNTKCRADKPCSIRDYGDENLPRPVIAAYGIHAFNFENGGAPRADGGYRIENLTIIAAEKSGAGIRLFNDVNDLTILNVHIEGFNVGVYAANSNAATEGSSSNEANDRIILKNSNIINNLKIGFLGSCNDCLIEGNNFENNGTHPSLDHNIYLSGSKTHKRGITVRNNTLYRSAIVDGICQGVSLVGHGLLEDVLIENNIIKEDLGKVSNGCWGISIDPGYRKVDESFRNIVIRNNKIINVGGNAIGCASCEGVTIEGNEIIDEAQKTTAGIKVPVREENTLKSSNIIVRNNKVVLSHEGATGIWVGGENISQVNGNEIILPTNTRSDCISLNQASAKIDISTNNCKTHNGVSIITPPNDDAPSSNEEQVAENQEEQEPNDNEQDLVDSSPVEDEQEVADNSQIEDILNNQDQEIVDNTPVQDDSATQYAEDNSVIDGNTSIISQPSENIQTSAPADINSTPNNGATQLPTVSDTAGNGSKVSSTNDLVYDGTPSAMNSNPRKASGDGSSSGGSSKSSSSSTSTNDLVTTDDVVSYSFPIAPVDASTSVMSLETEQMDISNGLPKTDTESSKYSVKVKDVIEASRNDAEVTDVTQCRAYAAGKCLMK